MSLKNILLTSYIGHNKIHEEFGEMVFTHYGISGPVALTMSNYINKYEDKNIKFSIDLKPALSIEKLDARILRDFEVYKNKQIKKMDYMTYCQKKLIPVVIRKAKIDEEKKLLTKLLKVKE